MTTRSLLMEASPGLSPWRAVAQPRAEVLRREGEVVDYALDLTPGPDGRPLGAAGDAARFAAITCPTRGLRELLTGALRRVKRGDADPIVTLRTGFGGGKTHALLALYHLFSGAPWPELARVWGRDGQPQPHQVRRAIWVGTASSPGQPRAVEPGGPVVRTVWGELAWRLGGAQGLALVAEADAAGVNPGSEALGRLLAQGPPAVIILDEWVAYARQLVRRDGLPAGSFGAQVAFIQSLTEAVKRDPRAFLAISVPRGDAELGGAAGSEALSALEALLTRTTSPWRPPTDEELIQIVRHRLFEPLDTEGSRARDAVIAAYGRMYGADERFPPGARGMEALEVMRAAYPLHPSLWRVLQARWSGLESFQRTRGVLEVLSLVVASLWREGDPGLLVAPCSVPLASSTVREVLLRHLGPDWPRVLSSDVDGEEALARRLDEQHPALGRLSAVRRAARAVWMATAPGQSVRGVCGVDRRWLREACTQPGEPPDLWVDALARLSARAAHLHHDDVHHWFSARTSLNRLVEDLAAQVDDATLQAAIRERLRAQTALGSGEEAFARVVLMPHGSERVPDAPECALVVLGPSEATSGQEAPALAQATLVGLGQTSRVHRNALVWLAPDARRLEAVWEAARRAQAWRQVNERAAALGLSGPQRVEASQRAEDAEETLAARVERAWRWLWVPYQEEPSAPLCWESVSLDGEDGETLRSRVAGVMVRSGRVLTSLGVAHLRLVLEHWEDRGGVTEEVVWRALTTCLYLPRVRDGRALALAFEQLSEARAAQTSPFCGDDSDEVGASPAVGDESGHECFRARVVWSPGDFEARGATLVEELAGAVEGSGARVRVELVVTVEGADGLDEASRRALLENCAVLGVEEHDFIKVGPAEASEVD